ncbi:MAG: GyrI-like domain-containing protein [Saprospiraceae bacterium]|nr:GyrI-like domain-containing protein [Saprospiraceae bacterium]
MTKKYEWRKSEKQLYLPKQKPEVVEVPPFKFVTIKGKGNPNSAHFSECIQALYAISYGIKMIPKKGEMVPDGYYDFTVYPLEGEWDLSETAKQNFNGKINKDDFVYTLMIRQPDFVDHSFFEEVLKIVKSKKSSALLDSVKFEVVSEGKCIQMLHVGSYDDEPQSFAKMEEFAKETYHRRLSKSHREIYLSDFRKVAAEKLKTVLRFKVSPLNEN